MTLMDAATRPTAAPAGFGADDLSVVLFGRPAAGKSSLLGALGEAALTQEHLLGGKLEDESGGLAGLRRIVYETAGKRTAEEVVRYPVRYIPPEGRPLDAVLMDCDGRVASGIMEAHKPIEDTPEGSLASEVSDADTLLLVTDASADDATLEADFAEFDTFLSLMEGARGERTEVGGLPVYLVLTKCDLLARARDTAADWMDRIEQRKRDVDSRFRAFLAARDAAGPARQGFGRIDLNVWATAVKRPPLLGAAAKPREPFAVAELFRQALRSATAYRMRADRSERRLAWMLTGLGAALLAVICLTVVFLLVSPPASITTLLSRAEELQFSDKETMAERTALSRDRLERRLADLNTVRDDPAFPSLPEEMRTWVDQRRDELRNYLAYSQKVADERSPAEQATKAGLDRQIERLKTDLAPPVGFEGTPAALTRGVRMKTAEAIRNAVTEAENSFANLSLEADGVLGFKDGWAGRAEDLLRPGRDTDPPPGVERRDHEAALKFDTVQQERRRWEAARDQIRAALDVAGVLGMVPGRPALLEFGPAFALPEAKARLARLEGAFKEFRTAFTRAALPPGIRARVAAKAREQYANLLRSGRGEVLKQLRAAGPGREETTRRWDAVRAWLKSPEELAAWRELAMALLRLEAEDPEDPIKSLASFLNRGRFTLKYRTAVVVVPIVGGRIPEKGASLNFIHPESKREPAMSFTFLREDTDTEANARRYTYRSDGREIVYRPGDLFRAELLLRGGKQVLAWADARSAMYQFEKLANGPRVADVGASPLSGKKADGVRLELTSDDPPPPVPDLMPEVRLDD